jgi:uncharacterized protein YgfB (UPF0149 family)
MTKLEQKQAELIDVLSEYVESILKYSFVIPMEMYDEYESKIKNINTQLKSISQLQEEEPESKDELKEKLETFATYFLKSEETSIWRCINEYLKSKKP